VIADMPVYRPGKDAKQAEHEHGITDAIKLASNENPDGPVESIYQAVVAAARGVNRYPDHRASALRSALAARVGVEAEQVTVGSGSSGILQQMYFSYVDPGDKVIYPWRSFEVYPVFARLMNGVAVPIPLTPSLDADLPAVGGAVTPATKLIFLATPNNPTGVSIPVSDLRDLLLQVPSSVIVVIDEAYREFADPRFGDPIAELLPEFPNAVVTRTFSKAHGLAGLRVGYAVGDQRVISVIDATMQPFAVNALAQAGALAALNAESEISERVRAIVAERTRVETALTEMGWPYPDHQGNFVWLGTGERTDELATGLERRGIVIRPFSGEGIRVTIGSKLENDRFLTAFSELV
jgi:histidinol-phosphate aminotransferase